LSPIDFISALFPSMFHRRLLLLLSLLVLVMLPLVVRLSSLTVMKADDLRLEAEKRLVRRTARAGSSRRTAPATTWPSAMA
jgi:hypothetical protein